MFLNTGTGFNAQPAIDVGDFSQQRVAGDFDGDGSIDLAVTVFDPSPAVIKILSGAGGLATTQTIVPANAGSVQRLALGDVIGDSHADLLAALIVPGQPEKLVAYPGSAGGTFGAEQDLIAEFAGDVAVADVNGDGLPDVLNRSTVHLAEPGGGYAPARNYYLGRISMPVKIADLNGDSRPDLISASDRGDSVNLLLHF